MSIYGAGHVSTKEEKIQGRKAELPALCFLNLSAHFYVRVTVWVRRLTHILTHTVLVEKVRKIPEIMRFQGFSGAAGRIRTADLILTNCSKAPKVLLSSAFGAFLFQKCVVFGAFRSTVSIRSFSRVGHGVGQTVFRIQTRGAPLTAAGQAAAPCLVRR